MDRYDTYITNVLSDSLEGVVAIRKEYWLSDEDMIAPKPNPDCFGETDNPGELGWLLAEAERLLNVSDTLFSTDTVIKPGSLVRYYLDETIFMVAWQQVIDDSVYSFSEVKIAHPSQFRRFLADGAYGSDKQYLTTEMAASVNAVVATSGDFYKFRGMGVIVYNNTVQRANNYLDVCYIDGNGDLLFSRVGELGDMEAARQFVEEHDIRFSLAFGPVLVDNYQRAVPDYYQLGEVDRNYSRAALAQLGELHYLMVTVNYDGYFHVPSIYQLADRMVDLGVEKAYALDGGQTATMVVNNMLFNKPDYGTQRKISDIIYFATAIPENE
jgi:exopolysaccharide biosynthesis protein